MYKGEKDIELYVSPHYLVWRNNDQSRVFDSFEEQNQMIVFEVGPSVIEELSRKGISNEKELRNELDKFKIELGYSKNR